MAKDKTAAMATEAETETAKTDSPETVNVEIVEEIPTAETATEDLQDSQEALDRLESLAKVLGIAFENPEDFAGDQDSTIEEIKALQVEKSRIENLISAKQESIKTYGPRLKVQKSLAQTAQRFGLPLPRPWLELVTATEAAKFSGEVNAKAAGQMFSFTGFEGMEKLARKNVNLYTGLLEVTQGSGGEGKLGNMKTREFVVWALKQGHPWPLALGQTIAVTFPNGKQGSISRKA